MRQVIHQFKTWQATPAKLQSNYRLFTLALLLAAVALIGTAVMVAPRRAQAHSGGGGSVNFDATPTPAPTLTPTPNGPPPDYSKVSDALLGYTHLLRQDDLVVNMGNYTNVNKTDFYPSSVTAITTNDSNGSQNFDGLEIPGYCDSCPYTTLYHTQDKTVTTGRFFRTVQDTVVSYPSHRQDAQGNNVDLVETMTGTRNGNGRASFSWNARQPLPYITNDTTISQAYVADFNGDGYDDLLMTYSDYTGYTGTNERVRVATANDVTDHSQGFNFGTEQTFNEFPEPIRATAVGDFNGDGQPDIAVLRVQNNNNLQLAIFSVDPQTLTVSYQTQITVDTLASTDPNQPIQLVAGNFTGSVNQQLVIANQSASSNTINVRIFDFAANSYAPVVQQTWDSKATGITNLKLLTSKYDWGSPYDVISLMLTKVDSNHSWSYVYLLTVDQGSYAITNSATVDVVNTYGNGKQNYVALDIAVGNFNNQKPNPAAPNDPGQNLNDPNLQLAVAVAYAVGHQTNGKENFNNGSVNIIQVIDQKTGSMALTPLSTIPVTPPGAGNGPFPFPIIFQNLTINNADLQGRSMRLGGGFKIKVERTSPSMLLAAPPMHVDYVKPANSTTPTLLNFSLAPDAFFSKYEKDTTTGTKFTNSQTKSMTFTGDEKVSETSTFGQTDSTGNLENGTKISTSFEAKQDIASSTDQEYGEYSSLDVDIAQQTTMADVLWYADNVFYLYVYEVVGQTVCKAGTIDNSGNCDPSNRVPLTLMFSGPTTTTTNHQSAETLEWYQPIWEYGNILSYPGSYGQLQKVNPKLDTPLNNNSSNSFATDSSPATEKATIVTGGNSTTTWRSSQLFTEDSDVSVEGAYSAGIPIPGGSIGSRSAFGVDVNLGGSDGTESLKVADMTSQASDTMTINKTAVFQTPSLYQYGLSPIIFGEQAPAGVDQDSKVGAAYPDKVTYGPLRMGFTVDPTSNAGAWWGQNYKAADVGFNHPNRWQAISTGTPSTGVLPPNCVGLGTTVGYMDCAIPKDRNPANPWLDSFHDMRGFFISQADKPGVGPQMSIAAAGDKLALQTRIYNNSFVPSQRVHVKFYGMKWNSVTNYPADATFDTNGNVTTPGGASFLIGEQLFASIPGFSSEPNAQLNSVLANATFDTTGYDDTNLVFWVAVWQEDASGNLVKDPSGKGLTAIPSSSSTVKFTDVAGLDEMVANPLYTGSGDTTDPSQISFSNNIGFYKFAFYIQEKSAATAQAAKIASSLKAPALNQTLQDLEVIRAVSPVKVDVKPSSIKLGQGSEVFAILHNGGEAVNGVTIYFYDGDPEKGGTLFDSERVAYIGAKEDYRVGVAYYPRQCGMHQVFIKVTKAGVVGSIVSAATSLRVKCIDPDSRDTKPPKLKVTLTPNTLSPANGRMIPVTAQIEVSDKKDPRPDVVLEAIVHNEASSAERDVAWASFGKDDRSFLLRAARTTDKPEGRRYKVVYSATDWAGNKTFAETYVTVPPPPAQGNNNNNRR